MMDEQPKPHLYSKVVKVPFSRQMFADLFKDSYKTDEIEGQTYEYEERLEISDGLPEDASLVKIDYERQTDTYFFIFESSEFDLVGEGEEIPRKDIEITSHTQEVVKNE